MNWFVVRTLNQPKRRLKMSYHRKMYGGGDDSDGCPSYPGDSDSPGEGDGSSGEGSGD